MQKYQRYFPGILSMILSLGLVASCNRQRGNTLTTPVQADIRPAAQTAQAQMTPNAGPGLAATAAAAATEAGALAEPAEQTAQALATTAGNLVVTAEPALQTAQALATQVNLQPGATVAPAEAKAAIIQYAQTVLGISVDPLYAGGLNADIEQALSAAAESGVDTPSVLNMALVSYGALFQNGGAMLSYGDGSLTGDFQVDINTASLGLYVLNHAGAAPGTAAEALTLIKATYPALADRAYTPRSVEAGFAWEFFGQTSGYDRETRQAKLVGEAIVAGVVANAGRGRLGGASIYIGVGRGTFATAVGATP